MWEMNGFVYGIWQSGIVAIDTYSIVNVNVNYTITSNYIYICIITPSHLGKILG